MKSSYSNLTPELFSEACAGTIAPGLVSQAMLDLASTINQAEAARLLTVPVNKWFCEPIVESIGTAVPRCSDRQVKAILTVAVQWGDEG
ncbi:MAG: hypothetical protein AAGF24_03065 [Cyanobacteria bacterium P01_H01_bin.121]